jgi:hypothetical protein
MTIKKRVILLTVLIALTFSAVFIQSSFAASDWNKTYAIPGDNEAKCVIQTIDGGYALAGFANSSEGYNARIIKTDESGNVQWDKQYGGQKDDKAFSIIQTKDGGFAFAGGVDGQANIFDKAWLVKIDVSGTLEWEQTFSQAGHANSIFQTGDGGYIVGCAWQLIKVDLVGKVQWNSRFDQEISNVAQTEDGGYVIAANGDSSTVGWHAYIVKVDSSGEIQFNQTYGKGNDGLAYSVIQTFDGGFVFAGGILDTINSHRARDVSVWLVKLDASGNMQWDKKFHGLGENNEYSVAYSVIQTLDGGYALAAETNPYNEFSNTAPSRPVSNSIYFGPFWLIKTDSTGNMQWNQMYQGSNLHNKPYSLIETMDGGFALAGFAGSAFIDRGIVYAGDFWLVKTDGNGDTPGLSRSLTDNTLTIVNTVIVVIIIAVIVAITLFMYKRKKQNTKKFPLVNNK